MSDKGRINKYRCVCGYNMVTIDREEGVTPMMVKCNNCGNMMRSMWYQVDQSLTPTHEWYMPGRRGIRKLGGALREHVEKGGLLLRKIETIEEEK